MTSGGILTSTSADNYMNGMATIEDNGLAVAAVRCRLNNPRVELTPGTGGGTGGISTTQARALISDWAETSNTDAIPADKLTNAPSGNGGGTDDQTAAEVDVDCNRFHLATFRQAIRTFKLPLIPLTVLPWAAATAAAAVLRRSQ